MIVKTNQNPKTKFTRMCIGEAIVSLMDKHPLERMTILSIVKRAGVARMSFYKYYHSPREALIDYMNIIISEYLDASDIVFTRERFMEPDHIVYSLKFFDRYRDLFLGLKKHGQYGIMIDGVNRFMEDHIMVEKQLSVYEMYAYAGGLLNTFLLWEERGRSETAEDVAAVFINRYRTGGNQDNGTYGS